MVLEEEERDLREGERCRDGRRKGFFLFFFVFSCLPLSFPSFFFSFLLHNFSHNIYE